jgi:hypothetical protein
MSCKDCSNPINDTCVKCFHGHCKQHLTSLVNPLIIKLIKLPIHKQCLKCK